jgi:hypothetical protein
MAIRESRNEPQTVADRGPLSVLAAHGLERRTGHDEDLLSDA